MERMKRFVVPMATCLWLLMLPANAGATVIGDLQFLLDGFFGPTLVVNNTSTGPLTDDFTSVEITLVDDADNEFTYGYDDTPQFVSGTPAAFSSVPSGGSALFAFDAFGLDPGDFVGAYATVEFKGVLVSSCAGLIPACLLPLVEGDPQPLEYTAVPEPATLLFVASGCALLGAGRHTLRRPSRQLAPPPSHDDHEDPRRSQSFSQGIL